MPDITSLLYGMASYTHLIAFGLLMLSGLNLPISEDLVFIVSASVAATVMPENTFLIFMGCYMGAFLSDSIAYAIGRFAGRKLLEIRFIRHIFHADKILTVEKYFVSYGGKTLFFGRFIPFGVRNVLFMTSGFVKMRYRKFFLIDLSAVTLTSLILFSWDTPWEPIIPSYSPISEGIKSRLLLSWSCCYPLFSSSKKYIDPETPQWCKVLDDRMSGHNYSE
jgi:membrane protein DedA with SNARE-associated domain